LGIFLDVQFQYALAEHANPLFRGAVAKHIADVEMPADERTINRVEILPCLPRRGDEIVPDILNGDFDAGLFRRFDKLANLRDRAFEAVIVRDGIFDDSSGDYEHRGGAI